MKNTVDIVDVVDTAETNAKDQQPFPLSKIAEKIASKKSKSKLYKAYLILTNFHFVIAIQETYHQVLQELWC
jgi:hypothetical protein